MRKRRRRGGRVSELVGVALVVADVWRRLPSKRRRQVLGLLRRHGPKVARRAIANRRGRGG